MKERFKILGFECLYTLLMIVTSVVFNLIQFAGKKLIASNQGTIFGGNDYRYNPIAYIAGLLLFGFTLWFLYDWVLKKHLAGIVNTGLIFKTCYSLLSAFFCIVMFFVMIVEYLFILGFNDNIYPELLSFITAFGWPAVTFIFTVVMMILASLKKEKPDADEEEVKLLNSAVYTDYKKKKK